MASNETGSAWHEFIHGWPLVVRIIVGLIGVFAVLFVVFLVAFLIIEQQEDVEVGLSGFKATRPETALEKNCRLQSQQVSSLAQQISNEIQTLEAQVATKDHELAETRAKCLAEYAKVPQPTNYQSRCRTEISTSNGGLTTYAIPRGDFETILTTTAQDRDDIESKISAKERLRTQLQQHFEQLCLRTSPAESAQSPGTR
jgi:hypothetical protein